MRTMERKDGYDPSDGEHWSVTGLLLSMGIGQIAIDRDCLRPSTDSLLEPPEAEIEVE